MNTDSSHDTGTEHQRISEKDAAVFEQRPPLRSLGEDERLAHLAARTSGVLATVNAGRIPASVDRDLRVGSDARLIRVSTRAHRAKAKNAARDPHAALFVEGPDKWSFVVAEGDVEVSPISTEPGDATGRRAARNLPPARRHRGSRVPRRAGRRAAGRHAPPRDTSLRRHHRTHTTAVAGGESAVVGDEAGELARTGSRHSCRLA